jgi:hypothetical protein
MAATDLGLNITQAEVELHHTLLTPTTIKHQVPQVLGVITLPVWQPTLK